MRLSAGFPTVSAWLNSTAKSADHRLVSNYDYFAGSSQPVSPPAPTPPAPPVGTPISPSNGSAPLAPVAMTARTGTELSPEEQMMLQTSAVDSYTHMHQSTIGVEVGMGLGFLGSIRVGFQLLPICFGVLTQQLSMLLVPFAVMVFGAVALFGYAAAFGGVDAMTSGGSPEVLALRFFPVLIVLGAVGSIGQAVVVADATDLLSGTRTSLGKAWATTANQLPRIVLFGVLYAAERTFTSIVRGSQRWNLFSGLLADVADRAWDFATYLAIPVILYENVTATASVKRSGHLVAQRWGVQLTARSVFGFAMAVATLPLLLLGIVGVVTGHVVLGIALLVLTLLVTTVVSNALNGILSAALYRFAVTGAIAPGFQPQDMAAVFSRR